MSALAVGDLVFGDILSDNNLRPWWEKFRGYFFAGSMFSTVSLVYLTLTTGIALECLPLGHNFTDVVKFTSAQAAAVNAYCGNLLPWYVTYVGSFSLGLSMLILIVSSFWLNHPDVIDSFRTFAEVDKIVSALDMTLQNLTDSVVRPIGTKATDRDLKLREATMLLWKYDCPVNVRSLYKWRSGVLTGILIVVGGLSLALTIILWTRSNKFVCDVLDDDLQDIYPGVDAFVCFSSYTSYKLSAFTLSFSLSQFGQALVTCIGLHIVGKLKETQSNAKKAEENANFMGLFWKSASPSRSGRLQDFINYIFSERARNAMEANVERAMLDGDADFLGEYSKLNNGIGMVQIMSGLVKKQGIDYGESEENLFRELRQTTFDVDKGRDLVEAAAGKNRWRIITTALDWCTYVVLGKNKLEFKVSWMKEIDLNLDELPSLPYLTSSDEAAGSILFYAYEKEFNIDRGAVLAPKCILTNIQDGRVKYVHFHGKSQTLKDFVTKEFGINEKFADVPEYAPGAIPSRSQKEIGKLYGELKDVGAKPASEYLQYLTNNIYRYKFTHWDENAKDLAKYSNDNRLWEVVVTLMNAYIVTEEDRPTVAKLQCDVTHFESLHEILPIALKTQPLGFELGYFVPTAARHILACCSPEERGSCLKYIHDPQNKLSKIDKTNLLDFIKRCNEDEITSIAQPQIDILCIGGPNPDSDSDSGNPTTENGNVKKPSELKIKAHASNDRRSESQGSSDEHESTDEPPYGAQVLLRRTKQGVNEGERDSAGNVKIQSIRETDDVRASDSKSSIDEDNEQGSDRSEKKKLSNDSRAEQKGKKMGEQTQDDADGVRNNTVIEMEEINPKTPLLGTEKAGICASLH